MRGSVQRAVLITVLVTTTAFVIPLGIALSARAETDTAAELQRQALAVAFSIGATPSASDPPDTPPGSSDTIGLYDASGRRTAGAGPTRSTAARRAAAQRQLRNDVEGRTRSSLVPVLRNEQVVSVVRVARDSTSTTLLIIAIWLGLTALAAISGLLAWTIGRRTAASIADPVEDLAADAEQLGSLELPEPTTPPRSRVQEVDAVRNALDRASSRVRNTLERERRFAGDTSHQLRTPLAGLRLRLELAAQDPANRLPIVHDALTEIDRMDQVISDLLAYTRTSTDVERIDTSLVIAAAARRWTSRYTLVERRIALGGIEHTPVPTRATALVLDVLLDNALTHGQGQVTIEAHAIDTFIRIDIADEGAPPDLDNASGHGLDIARRAAAEVGGRIFLTASNHTRFAFLVPRASSSPDDDAASTHPHSPIADTPHG